jgi:hypothetical protein
MYLNTLNATYEKPIASILSNGRKVDIFSSKIRNKTRMLTLTSAF